MIQIVFDVVWLLLPAGVANSIPVVAARYNWLPSLAIPIDAGTGIVGNNKTVRGFTLGVLFGSITGYLQYISLGEVPYTSPIYATAIGGLIGLGALLGDAAKSFIKRRLHITPGKPWRPFDQIDATLGALVAAALFVPLTLQHVVVAIVLFGIASWLVSVIGFHLHIKKSV